MTKYVITDAVALKTVFPQFVKTKIKTVKTTQEVDVLDQRAVRYALLAGITVPGVEKVGE